MKYCRFPPIFEKLVGRKFVGSFSSQLISVECYIIPNKTMLTLSYKNELPQSVVISCIFRHKDKHFQATSFQ